MTLPVRRTLTGVASVVIVGACLYGMWSSWKLARADYLFRQDTPASVAAAIRLMAERNRIIAEGAGATPVACVLGHAKSKIVCIVSGGNIDLTKLAEIFGTK